MAEPESRSTNTTAASAAPQHDWEVLSMSMSASAFGNANSAGNGKAVKVENPNSQIENPNPLVENPSYELGNPDPCSFNRASGSESAAVMWTDPFHAGGSSDDGDKITEPFTEEWKLHLSTPTDLYGYGAEHGYGEGDHQEESGSFNKGTEPSLQRDTFMAASKNFHVAAKEVAEAEKGVLLRPYDVDVDDDDDDDDQALKKKARRGHGGLKLPRKSRSILSIAVAATVLGIAMLGHFWRLERRHNQQLRLELSAKDEKLYDLMYQVSRLKKS